MSLTPEEVQELKNQLSQQIQNLPEEQKRAAQEQINAMSNEALEAMLEQQASGSKSKPSKQDIFRQIVQGEIPSKKIDENKQAIAVLDIRPISEGHIIIIPKKQVTNAKKIPVQAFTLSKKISQRVSKILKSKGTEIQTENKFGEIIINVIPYKENPLSINSPRRETKEKELEDLYVKLRVVKKPKVIKLDKTTNQKTQDSEAYILKRRIP